MRADYIERYTGWWFDKDIVADYWTRFGPVPASPATLERTVAECTDEIRRNPSDPAPYHIRGKAYRYLCDLERAIADYDEAIRLNPEIADVYVDRADALELQGRLEEAIADLTEAIRLEPSWEHPVSRRGSIYHDLGDWDGCLADIDREIFLVPELDGPANHWRAEIRRMVSARLNKATLRPRSDAGPCLDDQPDV